MLSRFSHVWLFATPWTVYRIFQQEHWSGLPRSPPGDLPDPGIEPVSLMSPGLAGDSMDCLQDFPARTLEWVATLSSRGSSWSRDWTFFCLLAWQAGSLLLEPPGKPSSYLTQDQHEFLHFPIQFLKCFGDLNFLEKTECLLNIERGRSLDATGIFILEFWALL